MPLKEGVNFEISEVDVIICSYFIGDLYGFSCIDFAISKDKTRGNG